MYLVDTNVISSGCTVERRARGRIAQMDGRAFDRTLSVGGERGGDRGWNCKGASRKSQTKGGRPDSLARDFAASLPRSNTCLRYCGRSCCRKVVRSRSWQGPGSGICRYRDWSDGPRPWADHTDAEYSAFRVARSRTYRPVPGVALRQLNSPAGFALLPRLLVAGPPPFSSMNSTPRGFECAPNDLGRGARLTYSSLELMHGRDTDTRPPRELLLVPTKQAARRPALYRWTGRTLGSFRNSAPQRLNDQPNLSFLLLSRLGSFAAAHFQCNRVFQKHVA